MYNNNITDIHDDEAHPAYQTPLYQKHNTMSTTMTGFMTLSTMVDQDPKSWSMHNHPHTSFHDHHPEKENILEIKLNSQQSIDPKNNNTRHPLVESHTNSKDKYSHDIVDDSSSSSDDQDHVQSKPVLDDTSAASYYPRSFPTPPLSSTSTISNILNHPTYHTDPARWVFDENKWLKRKNDELKQTVDQLTAHVKELKISNEHISQELECQYISKIATVKHELIQQLSSQHEFIQSRQYHQRQLQEELIKTKSLLVQKEDELKKCQTESKQLEEQLDKSKKESNSLKDQLEHSLSQQQKEIILLKETISDLTTRLESLKEKEKKWNELEQSFKEQQIQMNGKHIQEIHLLKEKWRQQAQDKLNQMKSKFKYQRVPQYGLIESLQNQVDSLQSVLAAERETSKKELEAIQLRAETEWKDKVNRYASQLKSKFKSLLENKVSQLNLYWQRSKEEMIRDHQVQIHRLREQHQMECDQIKKEMQMNEKKTDKFSTGNGSLIDALDLELTLDDSMDHHIVNMKGFEDAFSLHTRSRIH